MGKIELIDTDRLTEKQARLNMEKCAEFLARMITFAILLIFMWNALEIEDFDDFYIDVDDSSLRKEAEKILGRRIRISSGHEGMIENSK